MNTRSSNLEHANHDFTVMRAACVAPRPKTISDTGLSSSFLGDLIESISMTPEY